MKCHPWEFVSICLNSFYFIELNSLLYCRSADQLFLHEILYFRFLLEERMRRLKLREKNILYLANQKDQIIRDCYINIHTCLLSIAITKSLKLRQIDFLDNPEKNYFK